MQSGLLPESDGDRRRRRFRRGKTARPGGRAARDGNAVGSEEFEMTLALENSRETFRSKLSRFARDIKISHTVFALPFAVLSAFVAAGGWPRAGQLALILLCMVTARTVAMSANRLLDAQLDAQNPRTAGRAIPAGKLSRMFVAIILAICAAAFVASTA